MLQSHMRDKGKNSTSAAAAKTRSFLFRRKMINKLASSVNITFSLIPNKR